MRGADRGAKLKLKFRVFNSIKDATSYLKTSCNATVVGVEITSDASSLLTKDFKGNKATAFIFGNEGGGLSKNQRDACDEFVYIPQYRAGIIIIITTNTISIIIIIIIIGMASVNVACCSAIVLNYYAANVGFKEIEKQADAEKFILS
jgi:tRNA(Leu) C34 or U34 (ribose-2'-O)-methylase TrmL